LPGPGAAGFGAFCEGKKNPPRNVLGGEINAANAAT
jgi:hypothetical protein